MSVPVSPGSVPYEDLDPWIRADVDESLRRAAEYTKRMREIVEAEALRKTTDRPVVKQFSEVFSDTIAAVKLSDPTLTHDEAFARSWEQARFAAHAVRLSDPSTDPTPLSPAKQQQFDELDDVLLKSSVDSALRAAVTNAPKPALPELNHHYAAALKTIAQSNPPMDREAALKMARAAMAKDRAEALARNSAASNPSPAGGLAGTVL